MADKRINALANTAPNTASDDFIAIDGTTNGTRKLSAFNPTFGGNAVVTGTLTVNATGLSQMVGNANSRLEVGNTIEDQRAHIGLVQRLNLGNPIFSKNLAGKSASDAYTTISTTAASGYSGIECGYGGVIKLLNGTGATTAGAEVTPVTVLDTNTTRVAIPLSTASTTTSSGALVVSGGVGVGGRINGGEDIEVNKSVADNVGFRVINTNTAGLPGLYLEGDGGEYVLIRRNNSTAGSPRRVEYIATGSGANHYFNTNTIVAATTASTSTSSGALVVSGGVGVAGAVYVGGAGDFAGQLNLNSGTASAPSLKLNSTNNGIYYTGSNIVRIAANGAEAATFGGAAATVVGSFQTGAPSGGTAAAWKLGTVASVSPTSPNRTIEVDIGGTIYYIHAKTTNN